MALTHETEEDRWTYNCEDCVRTREIGEVTAAMVESLKLQEVEAFQQSMFWPVLQCMQRGVAVDSKRVARLADELFEALADREDFFRRILGHPLNPQGRKQMLALFYEDLKQPIVWSKPKKGMPRAPTLGKAALQTIWAREPILRPLIDGIKEWRTLKIFLRNFVQAKLDVDGRMRTSYNVCGTESFRLASRKNAFGSGTNLQNVPKGDEASDAGDGEEEEDDEDSVETMTGPAAFRLPNVRKIFVPDPGFTMFDTDLSKADLRIVVEESDATELRQMLAEGRDPYIEMAREYFRDPTIKKQRDDGSEEPRYRTFKSFAHGTHYLGTPQGLSERIGLLVHDVDRLQRWYFGRNPAIKIWQERFKQEVAAKRYVENIFGYRRYYFDRVDDKLFRKAIAWVPQSTVAIYINKIWKRIHDTLPHIWILLQVHDSLVGQFPTFRKAEALRELAEASKIVLPYPHPLIIPVGVKTSEISWGHCE